jgi:hypothetical protein
VQPSSTWPLAYQLPILVHILQVHHPSIGRKQWTFDCHIHTITMSQAKSQGVSFHPSQFAPKASTSNPGNEWKDFTEDDDDLDENQVRMAVS